MARKADRTAYDVWIAAGPNPRLDVDCLEFAVAKIYWSYVMFFVLFFFICIVLYVCNNSHSYGRPA